MNQPDSLPVPFHFSPRAVVRDMLALCLPFLSFYGWLLLS